MLVQVQLRAPIGRMQLNIFVMLTKSSQDSKMSVKEKWQSIAVLHSYQRQFELKISPKYRGNGM